MPNSDFDKLPDNDPRKGKPTYEIMINEYQRRLISRLLISGLRATEMRLRNEPGGEFGLFAGDSAYEEAEMLVQMFGELPQTNEPGMTHGFCL
jgi:hypothetical protein